MLSVPLLGDDTSSSELSDVPPSPLIIDTISSETPKQNTEGDIVTNIEANGGMVKNTNQSQSSHVPDLTPATAEVLARVSERAQVNPMPPSNSPASSQSVQGRPLLPAPPDNMTKKADARPPYDKASMMSSFSAVISPVRKKLKPQTSTPISATSNTGSSSSRIINSQSFTSSGASGALLTPQSTSDMPVSIIQPTSYLTPSGPTNNVGNYSRWRVSTPPQNVTPAGSEKTPGQGSGKLRLVLKRSPQTSGKKRKRGDNSDGEGIKTKISPSDDSDSEEYTPQETQTKSGRQVHRPSQISISSMSPQPKQHQQPRSEPKPKKKYLPASAKGKEQNILCEHCLRGNGPTGNAIVFCDGCNRAWHQLCHVPHISKEVVVDANKDWFCAECSVSAGPKKRGRPRKVKIEEVATQGVSTSISSSASATPAQVVFVGGKDFSAEEQKRYLKSLSKDQLIEKLLTVSSQNPTVPLFPQPVSTPANSTVNPSPPIKEASQEEEEDDDDEYMYDEHALLYPKAGQGVQLPPDSEDLHILLEGPDCKTFSHQLRSNAMKKPATNGVPARHQAVAAAG